MQRPPQCLTTTYTGITRILQSEVHVSKVLDPSTIPKALTPQKVGAKKFTAIWDTGATGTVISQRVVDACGLKPIGIAEVNTANEKRLSSVYLASIFLPNHVYFPQLRVTEGTISGGDVLIGMNIITRGDFAITNRDGKTTFSFRWPSTKRIDFVEEARKAEGPLPPRASRKVGRNDPCPCGSGKKYKNCCGK
jgi:predicted aspartyl protease